MDRRGWWVGGKEAESLGGSQAALSISVAEQSGLPAPLAMKTFPSPPPSPAPHPSLTAASSSPPLPPLVPPHTLPLSFRFATLIRTFQLHALPL